MKTNEGGAAFGAIGKERSKLLAMIMVLALMIVGISIAVSNGGDEVDAVVHEMPQPVGGVITLTEQVTLQTGYTVPEGVTEIDLNGQRITTSNTLEGYAITIPSGSDVLIHNGTIQTIEGGLLAYGDLTLGSDLKITIIGVEFNAVLTQGSNLTVNGADINNIYGFGIVVANSNGDNTSESIPSNLVFNSGSVDCGYFTVSTNNLTSAGCTIDINGGTFESTDSDCPAIYLPAMCEVTIDSATITGASGIEMKMGVLTIGSGTIINATGEYKQDYVPLGGGAGANGSAINIAAHQYGSVEGQAIDETNLHVTIQDGAVLNSANANDVDIFNMGQNDTDVLDVKIDIEADVDSVRIVNNLSIESIYEVPVIIADTSVVGTLIFTGNADVTVNGTVAEISGSMIGSLIIGVGSNVGFGSDYVNEGSIGVSDANGLKAALVAGGVIEVNDDIETSERTPFYITSNTTINGNGHSVTTTSTEQSSRVFSITGANSDYVIPSDSIVTINDLEVVGPTVVNYTRGITVHDTVGLILNINGGSVSAGAYAINIGGGNSGLTLNVSGTTVSGWCAFQTHSMVTEANFTDCVLIGTNIQENPASNGFSTIVINDEAVNASEASGDLLFDGCTIVAKMTTEATQMAINIRSMENSTITLCDSEIDMSETTAPMIYMAATNSVIIDGVLDVEGTATIFSENPEDGGTVTGGTINLDEGDVLILNNGTAYSGGIAGPDGTTMDLNLVAGEGGVKISVGSFIIDGAGSGTLTFSDGVEVEGSNEGMDFIFEGAVTFNNFTESKTGSLTFNDAEGNEYNNVVEAIEAGVDIRLGSDTSLSGLPFSTVDMSLEFEYDGTAHSPATGIPFTANDGYTISSVYISGGNCVSGVVPNMAVVAQTNVGTYTIQYTLVITDAQGQSVTYTPTIEWRILPQDVEITHDDISKEYDGTSDVEQSFTADADGLTLGDAYYTDINAGEGKEVRLPIVIAEGSIAENYIFTVNGAEAELMGDAESGYYIVLQGTITQKEITVIVTAPEKEYDGSAYEYAYSSGTGVEGDQLSVAVTTTGVDAGTYTGSSNLKFGDPIIMNGVIDVTDNYIINIDESSTLAIDQRDITVSPATGAVITKEYNGWSSRIMSESDFQMSGAIDGDDVSFDWTPGASNIWYNSPNVLEANTLTVYGLFLVGDDSSNYELPNTTVVFVNGENGLTVGIIPMILTISNGSDVSIEKTYDNGNTVPSGQIDTNDYLVSAAQNGTYPDIDINAAVFGSVNAGTGLTVYVTDATLVDGDNGVASNFALPEMQTTDDGIQYYFSITGANVKIDPITVDGNMVKGSLSEQGGQIILTVTVKSGDLELTDFGSTLKFGEESIDAIEGTNSYNIDESGIYTATVTSNDDNWVASNVEATIDVDFDYTANFFTQTTLNGEYILELTVSFENGMVHTPAATNVPEGYELVGWRTADGTEYGVGEYAPVSAIGTDFYAVYEEIGGSTPEPTGPTVTIDIPDEFPIGTEIEFTVSTTAGNYTGGNVQGTGIFEGIPGVDYNIWYWEVQDKSWHEWTSGNFGPEDGFPLSDATSKFKIQFINAGTYDLTVRIVTVSDGSVVCETSAVVDVPAENSLGYHVLDALDYIYADGGEYNADAYSYVAEFDADADSIIATYGHEYFEALIAYITNSATDDQASMAKDVMNDFARYMGALYRSSDGDVGRVYFNGTEYVWKAATDGKWLHGCNWRDESGVTLTSSVVDYIESTQSTGIIMEMAVPGGDRQVLTYSAVFEDAPTPDIQYYNVTLEASEGVQFYVLDGSMVVAGIYSVAEGAHTISAVAADGWQFTGGTPVFTGAENGQFEVVDQDLTISVSNVEQIVEESLEYIVNFSYQLVDGTTIETDQPKSMTVYFLRDQVPTVVLPVPTIDGYTFVGWYESDGEYFSGGGQVVLTSMETSLTARFIQMATYTVVFSGEGGQTYSNVAIGDAVVAPEVEVAEGYMAYWTTGNGFIVDLGERYYLSSMDVGENNTVTFTLVTEEIPEDPTYIITIPTGTGYTSMSGIISGIVSGQDRTFTINPTAGYAISAVNATYDEGGDVTINSYQNGESWIVTIYGITGDVTVKVAVEQKDVVDGVFVEADYAPYGASVTLSPVSSGDDGILPNGTITVFYTYRTTVTIDGIQYEGNTTGSFTAAVYTNDDGSSIDHVSVTGDYPESTIRGYAVFTDAEGNSYYSTFFTVNVLSEAGE